MRLIAGLMLLAATESARIPGYRITSPGAETLMAGGRMRVRITSDNLSIGLHPDGDSLWFANRLGSWEGSIDEFCSAYKGLSDSVMAQVVAHSPVRALVPSPQLTIPTVTVEWTNEIEVIAQQPGRKVRFFADGQPFEDVWMSADSALASVIDFAKTKRLQDRMTVCATNDLALQLWEQGDSLWPDQKKTRARVRLRRAVHASPEYLQAMSRGFALKRVSHDGLNAPPLIVDKIESRKIDLGDFRRPRMLRRMPVRELYLSFGL